MLLSPNEAWCTAVDGTKEPYQPVVKQF